MLHRDAALDAQNPFAKAQGSGKAPFSQQRYGGVVGGPIVGDKLSTSDPSRGCASARRRSSRRRSCQSRNASGRIPPTAPGFVKFDIQVGGAQSMTVRHRVDDIGGKGGGIGGLNTHDRGPDSRRTTRTLSSTHTAVLSPRRLNEFRFQFGGRLNRMNNTDAYSPVGTPQINRPSANFGKSATNPQGATEKRYQFVDNFSYNAGKHDFKAGTDISIIRGYSFFPRNLEGTFTFATDRAFDAADLTYVSHAIYAGEPCGRRLAAE